MCSNSALLAGADKRGAGLQVARAAQRAHDGAVAGRLACTLQGPRQIRQDRRQPQLRNMGILYIRG